MKKLFLLAILVSSLRVAFADNTVRVNSTIQHITVFRRGAEVNHTAKTTVPAGMSEIIFQNLPNNINERTIQIACRNDITILSVTYQLNHLTAKEKYPEMKALEDSLETLNGKLTTLMNEKSVLMEEQNMLIENRKIGGVNTGVSTVELKNAVQYFSAKLLEIKTRISELEKPEKKLREAIGRIQGQLGNYNQKLNQPSGEIALQVMSKTIVNTSFLFSYLVNDAGWTPVYDLRAENTKSPIELVYKANVYQNTDTDWKDVKLTISTGNPTESGSSPVLNTWWIDFYTAPVFLRGARAGEAAPPMTQSKKGEIIAEDLEIEPATLSDYTAVVENQLAVEFQIDLPYTIPSDRKPHAISMKEYSLPASYQYYAVPKLDKDAFLMARITDWEKLSLLPGPANIFFEGVYVGQSQINTMNIKDTLSFSMGRDKKIVIKREKIKDYTSSKVIGTNKKEAFGYEISVRNTKSEAVDIEIVDQVPISQNKDILVELEESSNAELNSQTGELKWKYRIDPAQSKSIKMIYSVKYPKDKIVSGL